MSVGLRPPCRLLRAPHEKITRTLKRGSIVAICQTANRLIVRSGGLSKLVRPKRSRIVRFGHKPRHRLGCDAMSLCPGGLGVSCTASIRGAQTQGDATPAFSPHPAAILGVHVARWPARREARKLVQPETVLAWCRHRIALTWKYHSRWRGEPPDRPRGSPTDPRDASPEFSLGCSVIIVSEAAAVSQYLSSSQKKDGTITIVPSPLFNGHNLFSQVRSR